MCLKNNKTSIAIIYVSNYLYLSGYISYVILCGIEFFTVHAMYDTLYSAEHM